MTDSIIYLGHRVRPVTARMLRLIVNVQPLVDSFNERTQRLDRQIGMVRVQHGFATPAEGLGARAASLAARIEKMQRSVPR